MDIYPLYPIFLFQPLFMRDTREYEVSAEYLAAGIPQNLEAEKRESFRSLDFWRGYEEILSRMEKNAS